LPFRHRYTGIIDNFRDRLPIADDGRVISLGEGQTPLIRLNQIPRDLGRCVDIYVKFEGLNPTCSFKDRGMTMAVSQAVNAGSKAIICASTGNTSASAAAYAARAGITAFVIIPDGKIAMGKLVQARVHGAVVLQIKGNFDAGMRLVREIAEHAPVEIVNSINPYRLQGQKTAAFEIVEELNGAPDYHCLPVGNAGNITAHWMGYSEYRDAGLISGTPKMVGYQSSGAAPFVRCERVADPDTVATAIRIGNPQSWDRARQARQASNGWFDELSDTEIVAAQRMLAQREGIFCEPASAAAVAGTMRDVAHGRIPEGSRIVCTLTGQGLKDPEVAVEQLDRPILDIPAEIEAVRYAIESNLPE
jgi:threonine synthase